MTRKQTKSTKKDDEDFVGVKHQFPDVKCANCGSTVTMFINDPVMQQPFPFCGKCGSIVDVVAK